MSFVRLAVLRHISRARKTLGHPSLDDEVVHGARRDLKRAQLQRKALAAADKLFRKKTRRALRRVAKPA